MRKQNNINSARKEYGYDFERNLQNLISNTDFWRKTSLRKPGKPEFMPTPPKHPYQKPGQSPFMPTPPKHPYQKPGQSPFMPSTSIGNGMKPRTPPAIFHKLPQEMKDLFPQHEKDYYFRLQQYQQNKPEIEWSYKPESRTKDVRKKMRKQNNINPAIANDPNDPLKRIIQREGAQGKQAISMQELQEILRSLYPENFPRPRPRPDGRMPRYPDVDPRPRPRPERPDYTLPKYPDRPRRPRPNPWTRPVPYNPRNPWGDSEGRPLPFYPERPRRPRPDGRMPIYPGSDRERMPDFYYPNPWTRPERPSKLPDYRIPPGRWNDEKIKPRTMDWRFDRDGYPPGHPAYDPNDPRSIKPIPLSKRMKKQNTINPAIANDPNDPLKRIIRREGTQTQSGSGNNDYISPERFARRKGYLPGGIKRPRRFPTYEGQMPANIVRPKTKPTYEGQMPAGIKGWRLWPGNEGYRTLPSSPFQEPEYRILPSSPFHKPEYRTLPSSPFHKPKVIRFGKNMSKRAIPTQRTDNTRNKYGI